MFCIEIHCVKLCKLISLEFIHLYFSRWQKKWSKEMVTKTGFMGAVHSRTRARRLVPETSALDHSATLPCLILFYCHCILKIIACAPRKLLQSIVVELPGLQRRPPAIGCDDFVFYGSVVRLSSQRSFLISPPHQGVFLPTLSDTFSCTYQDWVVNDPIWI